MEVEKHRVLELEKKIAELKSRLPRHSVSPSMLVQLEELEEELGKLLAQEMSSGKEQGDE